MTTFEKMKVENLVKAIDACKLGEEELRELRHEVQARLIRVIQEKEREAMYGKPKDGRRNGRTSRKRVPLSYRLEKKLWFFYWPSLQQ